MVSAPASVPDIIRVICQSIFKVPKKTAFCEVRNDLGGSQKSVFFDFLIIQIVLNYGVQDRSEAHSSRPRTQLS